MNKIDLVENKEFDYVTNTLIEHRKKYAQFFTPYKIAKFMCGWVYHNLSKKNDVIVLEPAIGLGIFSRILINEFGLNASFFCFDIDSKVLKYGEKIFSDLNINIRLEDYIKSDWQDKYDCIICNPPYFKFHDYDNINLISLINGKTNSSLNGFTNLYALFIIKSIFQLKDDGCAAYIVPSEFLNSDYGKEVKRQLILSCAIVELIVIDFEENVFEDALTTSCILLIKKRKNKTIRFHHINTLSQIDILENELIYDKQTELINEHYEYSYDELLPEIKWRNYYQNLSLDHLKNIVNLRKYCQVKRGIATGSNDYFVFNESKAKEYNINQENLLPCVAKANDIKNLIFKESDLIELIEKDASIYLIDLKVYQNQSIIDYIKFGEEIKVNERYLTKCRSPWYSLENNKPADLWVGVFNRDGIRVIWNKAKILNLTTFHGIYVNLQFLEYIDIIFAYFNTKIAKKIFEVNRREYGNGLNKMEPNDFNNSLIFDFKILSTDEISYIKSLVRDISENKNSESFVEIEKFFESKIIVD
jgi:adenine-specific DNA-methyltransferase